MFGPTACATRALLLSGSNYLQSAPCHFLEPSLVDLDVIDNVKQKDSFSCNPMPKWRRLHKPPVAMTNQEELNNLDSILRTLESNLGGH